MTGLEKILNTIQEEAQASADAIITQARREAEEILADANREAERKAAQIMEQTKAEGKDILIRAESAAALLELKLLLHTKQHIISDMLQKAREQLMTLSNQEYTDIILAMIKKYCHPNKGNILFSKADKLRLTADFFQKIKEALSDKPGAELIIAEEEPSFQGGFLLVYGDIEENCSFDALFAEEKEKLQDKVNSLLFD